MNSIYNFSSPSSSTLFESSLQMNVPPMSTQQPIKYYVDEYDEMEFSELNEEDESGNTLLIFAASQGREDLVQAYINQGANVNHQNLNGETALYWAVSQGHESIVDFFMENGANMNICTLEGCTTAHIAAANGHLDILFKLIRNGAYVNAQDGEMDSVLHYAVREGQSKIVEFLVKSCNAKVDVKNEDLETPLELALCLESSCGGQYSSIIEFLSATSGEKRIAEDEHRGRFTMFNQMQGNIVY